MILHSAGQWRSTTYMASNANSSPRSRLKVPAARLPANEADRWATSPAPASSRDVNSLGEMPNRSRPDVAFVSQSASGPPDFNESTAAAERVTARVMNSEAKPTSAAVMRTPAATTVAPAANPGRWILNSSQSHTGSQVNPTRLPSNNPAANGCASHAMAAIAATVNHASARCSVMRAS